uniref:Uncharacterized protein n=1 Tax=Tanacetum cinerariifolium TaxID=118510 RepID=A0A699HTH7_TANCI|nr:hypothetical protein [Tanacetum cinerariifolium]
MKDGYLNAYRRGTLVYFYQSTQLLNKPSIRVRASVQALAPAPQRPQGIVMTIGQACYEVQATVVSRHGWLRD